METSVDKTLLAFLLALYRLDTPLTGREVLDLQNNVGTLLELRPDQEAAIQSEIQARLDKNPELNQIYQEALTKLAPLDLEQLYHRLPPKNLLEQQLGITQQTSKGYVPKRRQNQQTSEVVNLSRMVMTSDRPDKSVKKLDCLAEYWDSMHVPMV
ncbi:hypothetical protein [Oscillatoria acuminata]|uniref:Uncharacterized protein n=1 Tax=Oscillatoria acuminata PCC 6304 TaxID=56110 RepID=K9TH04_9CYAN|nr:hypothetical protein [Oscillatoria acuminata]AFY82167.1 hypothetical protein Oscil6304_2549 [Oscillatoria acuminata PCC 6304]